MKQKGHHFITESYQRGFLDENDHVWILNPEGRIYNSNPVNCFKEDHFYTVSLPSGGGSLAAEKTLAEIEGAFISVLKNKIEERGQLSFEDRMYVAMFVAAMFTRTKVQRNHFRKQHEHMIQKMEEMKKAIDENPSRKPFIQLERGDGPTVTLEELKEHMTTFDSDESISTITLLRDIAPIIADMEWIIFSTQKEVPLLSSDNPLSMCSPERERQYGRRTIGATAGLEHSDVELTFPLSKTQALFASWRSSSSLYENASTDLAQEINSRTRRTASNLISCNKYQLEEIIGRASKVLES